MNTKDKARKAEQEYEDMKRAEGCLTDRRGRQGRFGKVDYFNEFDVLSINRDGLELAQVKCNNSRDANKRIRAWLRKNEHRLPDNLKCIVAVRHDGRGGRPVRWAIKEVWPDRKQKTTDCLTCGSVVTYEQLFSKLTVEEKRKLALALSDEHIKEIMGVMLDG